MPLLFTMEMWWLGQYANGWSLLMVLAIAFVVNLALASMIGFKFQHPRGWLDHTDEALDAVAIGIVASLIILVVLNRISVGDPLDSILGKIVLQALPLSIGVSVANAVFAPGKGRQGSDDDPEPRPKGVWQATFADVGATVAGGMFVGFSIAPTDEIRMLASELSPAHKIALVVLTLLVTYLIVFVSGFDPERRPPSAQGLLQTPLAETAMAYVVSLLVALGALALFHQADLGDPLAYIAAEMLVLGLPTAVGGAAGRIIV